jgi:hypothetical protein
MNHIETLAHILDQCRAKDAEIEQLRIENTYFAQQYAKLNIQHKEFLVGQEHAFEVVGKHMKEKDEALSAAMDMVKELAWALEKCDWEIRSEFNGSKLLERAKSLIERKDELGDLKR